ncbi:hypothetical protein A2U01_0073657, partial [Trifolium medium]|nr:hypothetical protein [Trifolium medium]
AVAGTIAVAALPQPRTDLRRFLLSLAG